MRKPVKKLIAISFLAVALSGPCIVPLLPVSVAQDRDDRRDQNDERAYQNNHYYKQGWKDGQHHKQRKHKWKNDDDRRAYDAGYARGDHGDKYSNHDRDDRH